MTDDKKTLKPRIGFIGMGNMGSRMSARFLAAGYPLTVYDRSKEKTKAAEKAGGAVAASPGKLASLCDVIMSCVTNDEAIEAVMFGADGALDGAKPGSIFIDLSTVHPATSRRIFEAAKAKGIDMLDATVSGSTPQAEQGARRYGRGRE